MSKDFAVNPFLAKILKSIPKEKNYENRGDLPRVHHLQARTQSFSFTCLDSGDRANDQLLSSYSAILHTSNTRINETVTYMYIVHNIPHNTKYVRVLNKLISVTLLLFGGVESMQISFGYGNTKREIAIKVTYCVETSGEMLS